MSPEIYQTSVSEFKKKIPLKTHGVIADKIQ